MRWRNGLVVLGGCVMCYAVATGCGPMLIGRIYLKGDGGGGSGGSSAAEGSGGGSTGAGGMDICNGTCYREEQSTHGPALVWMGQKDHAPAKGPDRAQGIPFSGGFEHLLAPSECEPCTCGTLIHTCTLPTSLTGYDVPQCLAAQGQPFDATPPWSGACDDTHPLPAPNNIQSLSVAAIDLVESCIPSPIQPQPPVQQVENWAIAYTEDPGHGCDPGYLCAPPIAAPGDPPEGFRLCMLQLNSGPDAICAGPVFTERHVYYQVVKDTRSCTACTCTPPAVKGTCTSVLSVYEDANTTCSGPTVFPGIPISSDKSTCVDINPSGKPLGSKSATVPQYAPAPGSQSCQPGGGVAQGQAEPAAASVFCCLPSKSNPLPDHPEHP